MPVRAAALTLSSMKQFVAHYAEMVLAMAAGMMVYGLLFRRGPAWTGYGDEAVMAIFMTVPMVAWMRYRRHSWRQAAEMAGAMLVPMAVVVVVAVQLLGATGRSLGMSSHIAMLLGMLALMVVRRADYVHSGHGTHGTHGTHGKPDDATGHAPHSAAASHAH